MDYNPKKGDCNGCSIVNKEEEDNADDEQADTKDNISADCASGDCNESVPSAIPDFTDKIWVRASV